MRIAFITAGAAGMYCGSCMHDNTLAAALVRRGDDALLIPTYTPIKHRRRSTCPRRRVFFGGINVFFAAEILDLPQDAVAVLDRLLDFRSVVASGCRASPSARRPTELGDTDPVDAPRHRTAIQAQGIGQAARLGSKPTSEPEIITMFTNAAALGHGAGDEAPHSACRSSLILQGDDIFLDELPENRT